MKKVFTLLAVICIAMMQTAISQNITLTFSGKTSAGNYVRLYSVCVQNLTRSWSETVYYPDTVLSFTQTGIADAQNLAADIASYPNPFNGTTNVSVALSQSCDALMQVYNLAGQKVAERTMPLEAGKNLFEVSLQTPQVYLMAVTTPQGRSTIKLLNRGAGSENCISYKGNGSVVEKRQSANPFQSGDIIKIIGYATLNGSTATSNVIQQSQTGSENFTLIFPVNSQTTPTVTTTTASGITDTSAVSGGNVTSDGGATVNARGVCWSTSHNPTTSDSHTTDGTGTGSFTSNITGLTAATTYYVRAYATNSVGTAYGSEITVTTAANLPTVTTATASGITDTSAVSGGNVTSDGGAAVTARGVCWCTSHNPTTSDSHTTDGTGTGSFTSNITGLAAATTYYVRAYATNYVGTAYGSEDTITIVPTGALTGTFSVGNNRHVRFSQGNLQYTTTGTHAVAGGGTASGTWRFAEHQWDFVGNATYGTVWNGSTKYNNANIASDYTGYIDLFGWGTSGYHNVGDTNNTNYQPYSTSSSTVNTTYNYYGYGPSTNMTDPNLTGTSANYDWGVYNAISNGGNQPGMWRTLTIAEWDNLINIRSTASGIRYANATVNGVQGLIIVPDNWSSTTYTLHRTNNSGANFDANVITSAQWATLENAGCAFLPAAGYRFGSSVSVVGHGGYYWSATYYNSDCANYSKFVRSNLQTDYQGPRYDGQSVRLVTDVQ